jgi:hypothetical protein
MKTQQTPKTNTNIQEIDNWCRMFDNLHDCALELGQRLVKMLDADPDIFEKIIKRRPGTSIGILQGLENVGRGTWGVDLFFRTDSAARRIQQLPPSVAKVAQTRLLPVARKKGGKYKIEHLRDFQLKDQDAARAINVKEGRIESDASVLRQAILEEREKQERKTRRYTIHDHSIRFIQREWKISDVLALADQLRETYPLADLAPR